MKEGSASVIEYQRETVSPSFGYWKEVKKM